MRENLRTLWPYLRRYRRRVAAGTAALLVKDIMAAMLPIFIGRGVDSMKGAGFGLETVLWFSAAIVGFSAVKGIFQYWMRVILIGVSRDIEYDLRNDFFQRLTGLSADFYGRTRTGDIMARATNDLNAVRMMLGPGFMYAAETGLTLIMVTSVMLYVDWRLTLMALLPAPLVSLAVSLFGRRIHDSLREHPENVLRHQQPRPGEHRGSSRGPRLRAGGVRTAACSRGSTWTTSGRTSGWLGLRAPSCRCSSPWWA